MNSFFNFLFGILILIIASLIIPSNSNASDFAKKKSQINVGLDIAKEEWSLYITLGRQFTPQHTFGVGLYTRIGTKSFTYQIPEICQAIAQENCRVELNEYLWGLESFYQFHFIWQSIHIQPHAGLMMLFNHNRGTDLRERTWFPIPIGSGLYIPLTDQEEFGISLKYSYWLNYSPRNAHHFRVGFQCHF